MFIKRNRSRLAGKTYESVLLVQGKRIPAKRPAGRPRADSPPPKSVVIHETLANLSRLPAKLIEVIEAFCKDLRSDLGAAPAARDGESPPVNAGCGAVEVGPCYGALAGLHGLARELGIVSAVGEATRTQRLALYLVYARLMHQGSRLSAARASEDHAVREVLEVGGFDEDDLYLALEYLGEQQNQIEVALTSPPCGKGASSVFLYDVTSVYFEGQHNELAEYGYNRDGTKGEKQMVVGLLTDGEGEPLSIQLYRGKTNDPPTFLDAVEKLKVRFGAEEVALVGDRGMIKALGKQALGEAKFRYVSLTTVERDFRTLKTGLLKIRPVFLRKEDRTRGHALVSLLALKLARELDRRMAPLGLTVKDAIERLKGVRLVRLGEPGRGLWRLPEHYQAAQAQVLEALPKLAAPVLSLGKANIRRLKNQRKGRSNQ
jgi:hypothetical protein